MMRKEWERIYWVRHTIRVLLVTRGKVIKMSEAFVSRLDWVGGKDVLFSSFRSIALERISLSRLGIVKEEEEEKSRSNR